MRPPPRDLRHGGHDRVVHEGAPRAAVERAGHEIAADEVERGNEPADLDAIPDSERLQIVVVAHRVLLMLLDVAQQVEPAAPGSGGNPAVVFDTLVAEG